MAELDRGTGAPLEGESDNANPDRRDFIATASVWAMAGGLVVGYGKLALNALHYLQPDQEREGWVFVAPANQFATGDSLPFTSPTGIRVVITRQSMSDPGEPKPEDFIALSSVCPHLGCRVHWESQNHRFFCPCHNGQFDPAGKPTGGPPLAANQSLPKYPLQVTSGLLYIKMPLSSVGEVAEDHSKSDVQRRSPCQSATPKPQGETA